MEIVIILAVALVAWLNWYLASQRGRSELGWAIAGILFGLLSTIVLLVVGYTEQKLTDNAIALHKAINK
jgi:hypothetical protein